MNKIDRFHFNSLILNWSRRKFFNALKQQRRAIKSMDETLLNSSLLKTRNQLIRRGFQAELVGNLFGLLEYIWQCHGEENLSVQTAWTAFLMLKGCAVETSRTDAERAMLLCACTVALTGMQVHWIVSDELRATTLEKKNAPLFQVLNIESSTQFTIRKQNEKQILIITIEHLAKNYLQDIKILGKGRLGLLLKNLEASPLSQMKRLRFALLENLDFWLIEKAFSTIEIDDGKQQITLYELFRRYQQCAGSLFGPPSLAQDLWGSYKVVPMTSFSHQNVTKHCTVYFFKNREHKWQVIAAKLMQMKQSKVCLIVTSSESWESLCNLTMEMALPIVMLKQDKNGLEQGNLLVLREPFPWLDLDEWLNNSHCLLLIADFCDSPRVLHYLEKRISCSLNISVEMLFSVEDKWLQQIEAPSIHYWLKRGLAWRKVLNGRVAHWLLKRLLTQAEIKRRRLHGEMSRWLRQQNIFQKIK